MSSERSGLRIKAVGLAGIAVEPSFKKKRLSGLACSLQGYAGVVRLQQYPCFVQILVGILTESV